MTHNSSLIWIAVPLASSTKAISPRPEEVGNASTSASQSEVRAKVFWSKHLAQSAKFQRGDKKTLNSDVAALSRRGEEVAAAP